MPGDDVDLLWTLHRPWRSRPLVERGLRAAAGPDR